MEQYEDGVIILKPLGVVFQGKKVKGKQRKYFFYTYVKGIYSTTNLTNILFIVAKCKRNFDADRKDIQKNVCLYLEIRKTLMEEFKTLPSV